MQYLVFIAARSEGVKSKSAPPSFLPHIVFCLRAQQRERERSQRWVGRDPHREGSMDAMNGPIILLQYISQN